jgi:hypothetical protein
MKNQWRLAILMAILMLQSCSKADGPFDGFLGECVCVVTAQKLTELDGTCGILDSSNSEGVTIRWSTKGDMSAHNNFRTMFPLASVTSIQQLDATSISGRMWCASDR